METREIRQVKVYFLVMNGVYDYAEGGSIAAVSTSKDRLLSLYNSEMLPDGERYRGFKEGPFFGYNPLLSMYDSTFGHGLKEEWVTMEELENIKHKYYFVNE